MPAPSFTYGLLAIYKLLGGEESSFFLLAFSHFTYVAPYAITLLLVAYLQIPRSLFKAAHDLGASEMQTLRRVVIPIIWPVIISALLTSVTLSANELVRTADLSGTLNLLSKEINKRMQSGSDSSTYAIGAINVLSAIFILASLWLSDALAKGRGRRVGARKLSR